MSYRISLVFSCPASVLRQDRSLLCDSYSVSGTCLFCKVSLSRGLQKFLTDSFVPSFPSCVGRRQLADGASARKSLFFWAAHCCLTTILPVDLWIRNCALQLSGAEGGKKLPVYPELMVSVAEETAVFSCAFHALTLHFCCVRLHMFLIHVVVSHSNTQTYAVLLLFLTVSGI